MEAIHITSKPRSGILGTLNKDDDDDSVSQTAVLTLCIEKL